MKNLMILSLLLIMVVGCKSEACKVEVVEEATKEEVVE